MLGGESSLQIQSNSWFTCAQLLAGSLWWWFGNGFRLRYSCIQNRMRKHPWYRLTLSLRLSCFHSHQCQQFHHVSSMDTPTYYAIGPLYWASPVQPRGLSHQQVHYFCLVLLSCEIQGRFAWEPQLTFELFRIDRRTGCRIWQVVIKTGGNLCFILHIGSRGCQRHGWTLNPNVLTCFKQEVCYVDRDRDTPQNHGSWNSRELWRREPEMRNPGKSHARHAHRSWKNLKFQILSHQNMPHWTAIIIVIAGEKLFSKRVWHRLRPPAVVVLDVHRGLRRQQQLGALHAAVECCRMQRSPTSAPQASEAPPAAAPRGFWAPAASELPGQYIISHFKWSTFALPIIHIGSPVSKKRPLCKCQRQGWTPKLPVSTKCAALIATETCPKITALEFQGNFEDGNLRWEIQGNPMPIEVERTWNFKFQFIKTCHIELQLLLWLPVKNCFQNSCDIGWGPRPSLFLTSTEAFAANSSLAISTLPFPAASCSGVRPQHRRRRRHHLLRLAALSSRAAAAPDVHGRALRQEKFDDRRVVFERCRVQCGPAAAPQHDRAADRPHGLEELVEAAPVAAQVAPHRRQVVVLRRPHDVLVSARGEMQQKWSSSVPLIFMFYLF